MAPIHNINTMAHGVRRPRPLDTPGQHDRYRTPESASSGSQCTLSHILPWASLNSLLGTPLPVPPKMTRRAVAVSSRSISPLAGSASPGRCLPTSQQVFELAIATPKKCGVCENSMNPTAPWFAGYGLLFCSEACRGAHAEEIDDEGEWASPRVAEEAMQAEEVLGKSTANPGKFDQLQGSQMEVLPWFQRHREQPVSPSNVLNFGDSPTKVLDLGQSYYTEAGLNRYADTKRYNRSHRTTSHRTSIDRRSARTANSPHPAYGRQQA